MEVYSYHSEGDTPCFELIERVPTVGKVYSKNSAVAAIKLSPDENHVFITNAGDNSIAFYDRDAETGRLTFRSCLPISGDYPKELMIFPDGRHLASLNHDTGTLTFFAIDYEKGLLVMHGTPMKAETPNCCIYKKISE